MAKRKIVPTLSEEVRDALLEVLRDAKAPPTAKAIAGRSLVTLLNNNLAPPGEKQPTAAMSLEELDAEIAAYEQELH